jgi:hypothetical protein
MSNKFGDCELQWQAGKANSFGKLMKFFANEGIKSQDYASYLVNT